MIRNYWLDKAEKAEWETRIREHIIKNTVAPRDIHAVTALASKLLKDSGVSYRSVDIKIINEEVSVTVT